MQETTYLALNKAGADSSLTHDQLGLVGSGYTVTMLAAELDELELLKAFEENSADSVLKAVYLVPVEGQLVGFLMPGKYPPVEVVEYCLQRICGQSASPLVLSGLQTVQFHIRRHSSPSFS